ncbi:NYN domain-containing protein [Xanthomonas axonopodis]
MASLIYVDFSNFFLTGGGGRHDRKMFCNFDLLYNLLSLGDTPKKAVIFGSAGSKFDFSQWNIKARTAGFDSKIYARKHRNEGEVDVDSSLIEEATKDSYTIYEPGDEIILVAGDGDYLNMVKDFQSRGVNISIAFWTVSINKKLKSEAFNFVSLMPFKKELIYTNNFLRDNKHALSKRDRPEWVDQ